jgi:5-methylcytosine-specific restriction endonuclease McrA
MDIITKAEAKAQGLTRYFTGKQCLRGHVSPRLVSTKNCCQCDLGRQQTPEARAAQAAFRQLPEVKAYNAERQQTPEGKAQHAVAVAKYYAANAEQIAARHAAYRKLNAEQIAAYGADYRKANPHIQNAIKAKRRATQLQATPPWVDFTAIKAIYKQCAERTRITGIPHAVDHVYPLQGLHVSGLHVAANLQILTASENSRKSNKLPTPEQIPSDLE